MGILERGRGDRSLDGRSQSRDFSPVRVTVTRGCTSISSRPRKHLAGPMVLRVCLGAEVVRDRLHHLMSHVGDVR